MKKSLLILMAALLSVGTMMAQSAKMSQRLEANPAKAQSQWNLPQSMAKDVVCNWNGNTGEENIGFYWKQDHTNGIYNWAEKFTNDQPLTVDSFAFVPYLVYGSNNSSVTVTVYEADATGAPGTTLGSKTLTYGQVTELTENFFAFDSPITVTGDYFIAFALNPTPVTDTFALLTTGIRTDGVNTAWFLFGGDWYGIGDLFTSNNTPLNCSFFIWSHTCTADLQGSYTVTATANNPAWGTVTGGGTYNASATCTLTATPNEGYRFVEWQDGVTNPVRSFTVLSNATYTATFAEAPSCHHFLPYTCGFETEDELYCWNPADVDGDGYTWMPMSNWGGHDGSETAMASASFINNVGPLTPDNWVMGPELVVPVGGATLTWWVKATDPNDNQEHYSVMLSPSAGTSVTSFTETLFTETLSDTSWHQRTATFETSGTVRLAFRHFDCTNMYWLLIDDLNVEANNPTENYTITVTKAEAAACNDFMDATVTGGGTYAEGTQVTLTATPGEGDIFVRWNDNNTDNPRVITVTGNATYTAYFKAEGGQQEGIDEVEQEVLRVEYYDVLGRQLSAEPAQGLYLIRTVTAQGASVRKVVRK